MRVLSPEGEERGGGGGKVRWRRGDEEGRDIGERVKVLKGRKEKEEALRMEK
jgi:hypothetical protein